MKLLRFLTVATAAAVLSTGCESAQTERLLAPSADIHAASTIGDNASVSRTKTVRASNKAIGLIGTSGGSISVGGHTLKVPSGAVSQLTWFSVHIVEANAVHVKLKAWRASDGAAITQFTKVPVELTLDASDLDNLDPTGLVVVYLREGTLTGAKEKIVSSVNAGNLTVTGYLTHFSSYALAREYSMGVD